MYDVLPCSHVVFSLLVLQTYPEEFVKFAQARCGDSVDDEVSCCLVECHGYYLSGLVTSRCLHFVSIQILPRY